MKTNELRKGDRVQLRNGWFGTVADNARGSIRMVTVEGDYTETGSVYSHDIFRAQPKGGAWELVEHTPAQLKLREPRRKSATSPSTQQTQTTTTTKLNLT